MRGRDPWNKATRLSNGYFGDEAGDVEEEDEEEDDGSGGGCGGGGEGGGEGDEGNENEDEENNDSVCLDFLPAITRRPSTRLMSKSQSRKRGPDDGLKGGGRTDYSGDGDGVDKIISRDVVNGVRLFCLIDFPFLHGEYYLG